MKNILLIGAGRFGRHMAEQLTQLGHQVMAVDTNEERINDLLPFVTNAQIGDSTSEDFLRSLGVANFDVCIVTIGGSFQNSLETASLLKELGARCVVAAQNAMYRQSFCFATARIMWFILKSRLRNGRRFAMRPIISLILWKSMISTRSLRSKFRNHGRGKPLESWTFAGGLA